MCGKLYFLHFFFFPGACYSCKRVQLHCEMHSPHCAGSCSLNRHATLAEPQLGSKMGDTAQSSQQQDIGDSFGSPTPA